MTVLPFKPRAATGPVPDLSATRMPDFSHLNEGERMVAEIMWRKANPPPPMYSTNGLYILDHDPAHPQWKRPIVWTGEAEVQIRALAARLCFERIPFALEELIVFTAYVRRMLREQASLKIYPDFAQEDMRRCAIEVAYEHMARWAPGIDAFLHNDTAKLTALHRADVIYPRLLKASEATIDNSMAKALSSFAAAIKKLDT